MTGSPSGEELPPPGGPHPTAPDIAPLREGEPPPWDWTSIDDAQRAELTVKAAQFVDYFNARYAWTSEHTIPPCWADHGALIEEITTLMWSRWLAFTSPDATAQAAQNWHTYTLPGFLGRLAYWVGSQSLPDCQAGNHQPSRRPRRPRPRPNPTTTHDQQRRPRTGPQTR